MGDAPSHTALPIAAVVAASGWLSAMMRGFGLLPRSEV